MHHRADRASAQRTLRLLHGDGHVLVGGDLTDPATARRVVNELLEGFGGHIDVLVNNAALGPSASTYHLVGDTDYDTWQQVWREMIDIDLHAPANMTLPRRAGSDRDGEAWRDHKRRLSWRLPG